MYYDPSNPATFGPNTSIAYGGLPQPVEPAVPAAPAAPAPQLQQPAMPAAPQNTQGILGSAISHPGRPDGRGPRGPQFKNYYQAQAADAGYDKAFGRYMGKLAHGLALPNASPGRGTTPTLRPDMAAPFFSGTPWAQGLSAPPARPMTIGSGEIQAWRQQYGDWLNQAAQQFQNYQQSNPEWQKAVYDWWAQDPRNAQRAQRGLLARDMREV